MSYMQYDPKFWLKYELEHFIEISNKFDQFGIPQEYKQAFFQLFIESINEVFHLSVLDPWNGFQNSAWETILRAYSQQKSFDGTVVEVQEKLEEMREESRMAEILAERDRWHYEND